MARALALVVWRFANTQAPNGGWDYTTSPLMPSPRAQGQNQRTTGAGVLGLAMGYGLVLPNGANDGKKVRLPKNVEAGIKFMAPHYRGTFKDRHAAIGGGEIDLYYWWTLNRVAMIYGLRTIDGKPWYEPGVQEILTAQRPDGSWRSMWLEQATPMALMFLKRCNLCQDLADTIQGGKAEK
jgi:hypothetical protein